MRSQKAKLNALTGMLAFLLLAFAPLSQASSYYRNAAPAKAINCLFSPWLSCLNDESGDELWHERRYSDPARFSIHDGQLYISHANTVTAHDLRDGRVVWQISADSDTRYFYPVIDHDHGWLYIARSDGSLDKYTAASGRQLWSVDLGDGWVYPPLVAGDQLITGGQDRVLWLLDAEKGTRLDRIQLAQELAAPLFRAGELAISSTFDGHVQAWRLDQQQARLIRQWSTRLPTPVFSFVADDNTLIAADMGGEVHSINLDNGSNRWQQPLHGNAFYWNTLHQQRLISLGASGVLFILDAVTGERQQTLQFSGRYGQAPVVRGDELALYDQTGTVRTVTAGVLHGQPGSQL